MSGVFNSIPEFDCNGNLPPGDYAVNLNQIEEKLTWTPKRKKLFKGLKKAVNNLAEAGVTRILLAGSFVSDKDNPSDIDGCFRPNEFIDVEKLDPVFIDFEPPREAMKRKYGVDFMLEGVHKGNVDGPCIEDFFRLDRDGNPKGILLISF